MRKVLYILGQLTDGDIDWLAEAGRRIRVPAGETVIDEGIAIDEFFIVLDGRMRVHVRAIGDIAHLSTGEVVGEMSMIDSRPPSASVIAARESTLLAVDKTLLQVRLDEDDGFAARFYKALAMFLSDRLRDTVHTLGYGTVQQLDETTEQDGELDLAVLGSAHLAGHRFDALIRTLNREP
ncbi:MAG: cyclic nucleotide-binding domain-containing protein [Rhodobacteraceae bacterium]|nr:cyclic nucleotide-binding domain-containing protein [Paracoccaceae bacterium]